MDDSRGFEFYAAHGITTSPRWEANLVYSKDELIKIIHESKALSIWNRNKGPVFWYIANVPGPFYINTEIMIGGALSAELLKKIDGILAASKDAATRANELDKLILPACDNNPVYKNIVETMVAETKKFFADGNYDYISGGERRDWLFSIPMARSMSIKHVYLFKDKTVYCREPLKSGENGVHVSDLINNAASYFDAWLPALEKSQLNCVGTVCLNSRGTNGVQKLKDAGKMVVALSSIELAFFKQSQNNGLIDAATYDEIALHFKSPKEWAGKYLLGNPGLFDVKNIDKKSFERLRIFVDKDPWELKKSHAGFVTEMQKQIDARLKQEAA